MVFRKSVLLIMFVVVLECESNAAIFSNFHAPLIATAPCNQQLQTQESKEHFEFQSTICKPLKSEYDAKSTPRLKSRQLYRAYKEFEQREQAGEIDFRVLVAVGVNIHRARKKIEEKLFFEIEFEGDPSDNRTTGDLYLTRNNGARQSAVVIAAVSEFYTFNVKNGYFFSVSQEYVLFNGRIRHPSLAIFPRFLERETLNATVLLEVEFEPRSLQAMNAYCLEYFCTPFVRAVVLLKFFPQHAANPRPFEAVSVLYRRGPGGAPAVADAVSFGTAPFSPDSLNSTLPDVRRALRVLPPAPCGRPGHKANPWAPALRPFLTVPAEDLRLPGDGARGEVDRDGPPGSARDFTLDLWDKLQLALALAIPPTA